MDESWMDSKTQQDSGDVGDVGDVCEETRALLALNRTPGVGPRIGAALLERFGSALGVYAANDEERLAVDGVGSRLLPKLRAFDPAAIEQELERCTALGIQIVPQGHPAYPNRLKQIHDPPPLLFMRGEFDEVDEYAVAIVGTRRPSRYGTRQAERLASALARCGVTVISGLARGIDAAAHEAALSVGGRTVAVMAGGLGEVYPPEHEMLAREIMGSGAMISEWSSDAQPRRSFFPRRNRIISGIALGVVVVEATRRSGALITARHAVEQDREVFAVPGEADSKLSVGCHQLLRDGAKLVASVDDILEELMPQIEAPEGSATHTLRHPAELSLNDQERAVFDAIGKSPTAVEAVLEQSGLPVQRVLATLSVLETRRLIDRVSPQRVVRRS